MDWEYQCQRCGACCRWPGQVRLETAELAAIAGFLAMTEHDFIQHYTRLRPDRQGLALTEQPNGDCVFFQAGQCAIQPVKPRQCRDYPNSWRHPEDDTRCQAIRVPTESSKR